MQSVKSPHTRRPGVVEEGSESGLRIDEEDSGIGDDEGEIVCDNNATVEVWRSRCRGSTKTTTREVRLAGTATRSSVSATMTKVHATRRVWRPPASGRRHDVQ